MNATAQRRQLLEAFVATWPRPLRGRTAVLQKTDSSKLEPLYAKLPARFPPLYEQLVLTYRWAEVDLGSYRLCGNPPGPDLLGLFRKMQYDRIIFAFLLKSGFIPFGKGPDMDYDPVCFDLTHRKKNRECEVVKLDHEEILCNERIKAVARLAPTFEALVGDTIAAAKRA